MSDRPGVDSAALYEALVRIGERPAVFSRYTAEALWASADISEMMLRYHLDGRVDLASRRTETIEASVAWIRQAFGLGPASRVIDLGCGPGLYVNRLAASGASVTGVDFSPRSIAYARSWAERDGVTAEYRLGDYLHTDLGAGYDLALMIWCDYCVLSPEQRRRLLERVRRILLPGGAFLFDVHSQVEFEAWEEQVACGANLMDGFWSSKPYFGFLSTFRYEDEKVALEKYTIVERDRISEYYNWFAHFDVAGLTAEIESAGLVVASVLGDVAGGAFKEGTPEFAVVARRP